MKYMRNKESGRVYIHMDALFDSQGKLDDRMEVFDSIGAPPEVIADLASYIAQDKAAAAARRAKMAKGEKVAESPPPQAGEESLASRVADEA